MRRTQAVAVSAFLALALLDVPGAARAEDRPGLAEGRISVVGRARSEVAPDFASVEIGVEARGATPAAALDGASTAAKAILALAADFKVPEADLGTSAVTLQPVTRSVRQADGSFAEKPDGYRAANTVRVRLADMGRLGDLMRRALDGGANRIDGVGFGLRVPFVVYAIALVVATLVVGIALRGSTLAGREEASSEPGTTVREAFADSAYRAALFTSVVFGWVYSMRVSLLPLFFAAVLDQPAAIAGYALAA